MIEYIGFESILFILFLEIFLFGFVPLAGAIKAIVGDDRMRRSINLVGQVGGGALRSGLVLPIFLYSISGAWTHVSGYFRSGLVSLNQFVVFIVGTHLSSILVAGFWLLSFKTAEAFVPNFFDSYFDIIFPLTFIIGGANLFFLSDKKYRLLRVFISLFVVLFSLVVISGSLDVGLVKYSHLVHPLNVFLIPFGLSIIFRSFYFVLTLGLVLFASIFNPVQMVLYISGGLIGIQLINLAILRNFGRATSVVLFLKSSIMACVVMVSVGSAYFLYFSGFSPKFSSIISDKIFSFYNHNFSLALFFVIFLLLFFVEALFTFSIFSLGKKWVQKLCFPKKQMQSLVFPLSTDFLAPLLLVEHVRHELKKQMAMVLNVVQLVLNENTTAEDLLRAKKYELIIQKVNSELSAYAKSIEGISGFDLDEKELDEGVLLSFKLSQFSQQFVKLFVERNNPVDRRLTEEEKKIALLIEELFHAFIDNQKKLSSYVFDKFKFENKEYVELRMLIDEIRCSQEALMKASDGST